MGEYAIREKGLTPKLKDLAQFVKRQAAIKNDPGFTGVSAMPTTEVKANKTKPIKLNKSVDFTSNRAGVILCHRY